MKVVQSEIKSYGNPSNVSPREETEREKNICP